MKKLLIASVMALVLSALIVPTAALAHGGSVNPPTDQVDCRGLEIYGTPDNPVTGQDAAKGGLTTAGESTDVVSWSHCD